MCAGWSGCARNGPSGESASAPLKMSLDAGQRSGQLVAELTDVGKAVAGRTLIAQLSMRILRGDRVGLIGPNGAGKTTLIRLILGELPPDEGSVRLGTNLKVAYFDQLREQLDPEATLADMISPGSDWVEVGGERKHVIELSRRFPLSGAAGALPRQDALGR